MSGVGLKFDVADGVTPPVRAVIAGLGNPAGMHAAISTRARNLVIHHLIGIATTRHKTARELGAQPSGHWEDPASYTTAQADASAATISIRKVGIGRVAHDVVIVPSGGRKFLAIPVIAEAYGQRAYRIAGLVAIVSGNKGVLMMPQKGTGTLYGSRRYSGPDKFRSKIIEGGRFGTVWFVLVRSVRQKQDRTLLPSDEAFRVAALEGLRDYLTYLRSLAPSGGRN